ncbi:hypothetical protein [Denitrobaculum tricleocarpae]|nr:hypothetical protein [Denitrobaculum tricleocarpae]
MLGTGIPRASQAAAQDLASGEKLYKKEGLPLLSRPDGEGHGQFSEVSS